MMNFESGKINMASDSVKILLVDDEPDILEFMEYNLKKEGYDVYLAKNGKEAIDIAKKEKPQLIILDIMMPVMDGYEATKRIRQNPKFKKLPIIALTAKAMKDDRQLCIEAGANDYLSKPFKPQELYDKIMNVISGDR